jgi:hypothetical protein
LQDHPANDPRILERARRLWDAAVAGRVLHEGCAPMPAFAEMGEDYRREAVQAVTGVAAETVKAILESPGDRQKLALEIFARQHGLG